ncbi:hypothetical protein GLOIN_2v1576930 [Rhizophagus irregularis DAOM 181602=DAOM 197198]|uniref:Uncharacterized protein n=1 Tax=Rhizophagus irregularis (strain DAOM 181602 / DAOM 197198 / MUCL 43194) TaxID=747089 RepID=A0A2P4Q9Z9_RHIID|nr:hypothetical protein GLOIN_2v1576930 [Rhizophagus irregularis DAOM 181602=DAOM 197198]POG74428.1 hypothetical protein GLOIN_2v1576930 [Rhizophagus irregularis DAOM 181602=DAOM 197198]|eukprot:XP_025181294.1 hypothetical protein GLOIN_2v1576930 [Rhizophagus irregularis DAOM 181602=DAOM 197198]
MITFTHCGVMQIGPKLKKLFRQHVQHVYMYLLKNIVHLFIKPWFHIYNVYFI